VAGHEGTSIRTASINWFPTVMSGSFDPSGGQCEGCRPDEPGLDAPSSPNHYPDPDWDSPSVTAVGDEEEEVPDGQRMLELLPQSDHPSDGALGEDRTDDALSLEDVRWPEDSPPNPTLVSAYGTDASPEVFEDLLDPATRDQVFDATAAYAAVLVVFIGSYTPVKSSQDGA
jgi:hypothetical protein